MSAVPRVSVVIPAYNLARYLGSAIDSVLASDWPAEALEVVVVDDGSTDETPALLAGYGDRIRAVRQANGGLVAAVDRGLAEATGDLIALMDADDECPPDRLRIQAEHLVAHPEVGLVHGDMELVDADGVTFAASFFQTKGYKIDDGRVLGRLLSGNFVSGGASMLRASLRPAVAPIPADAAYPDWWLAATVAAVAEVRCLPGIFNRYRQHDANMGLGAGPERRDAILASEIPWRRWMFRHLSADATVTPAHLRRALDVWDEGLACATRHVGGAAWTLAEVSEAERARARRHARDGVAALAAGDAPAAARLLLTALAHDPWDAAIRHALDHALALAVDAPAQAAPAPVGALPVRAQVTLAWADALVADPSLLAAYAGAVGDADDATLVVLTRDDAELAALVAAVGSCGLDRDDAADLLAHPEPTTAPARALLAARATAALGPQPDGWALPAHPAAAAAAAIAA